MPTDKPTDLRAALRALPYSEGNVKRALVIDLLPPGDEPVYAVTASGLAAAIRRTAPQRMWPVRGVSEVSNETFAAAILAELKR